MGKIAVNFKRAKIDEKCQNYTILENFQTLCLFRIFPKVELIIKRMESKTEKPKKRPKLPPTAATIALKS